MRPITSTTPFRLCAMAIALVLFGLSGRDCLGGACCISDGTCVDTDPAGCSSLGIYYGDDTTCAMGLCSQPLGACCYPDGGCAIRVLTTCTGSGTVFLGPNSNCSQAPCIGSCCNAATGACTVSGPGNCTFTFGGRGTTCTPPPCGGACCAPIGDCTITAAATCPAGSAFQGIGVACTPTFCPAPPLTNDDCAVVAAQGPNAIIGGSVLGTTRGATPDGVAPCGDPLTAPGGDVYYRLLPMVSSYYRVDICAGSGLDAVLSVETACAPDASTSIACDIGSCSPNSAIEFVRLAAGTPYLVRIGMINATFTQGSFRLAVTQLAAGACCDPLSGACVLAGSGACAGVYRGDNTSCTPGPCGQGACCNPETGACALSTAAGCTGGGVFNVAATACVPTPCPTRACCAAVSGVCVQVGSVACPTGTSPQGPGIVCGPNPCPIPPGAANNDCASALHLTLNAPLNNQVISSASGTVITTCSYTDADVWYSFTPADPGDYIALAVPAGPIDAGIALAVFNVPCDPPANSDLAQPGACADQHGNGSPTMIRWTAVAGTTYLIRAGAYTGDLGAFSIVVSRPLPPPPNDLCSSAINLNAVASFPGSPYRDIADTSLASNDGVQPPSGACNSSVAQGLQKSVWYRYTTPSAGGLRVRIDNTNQYDMLGVLYTGASCTTLVEAPNDQVACTLYQPQPIDTTLQLNAGVTYWLGVGAWGTTTTAFGGPTFVTLAFTPSATGVCCRGCTCTTTLPRADCTAAAPAGTAFIASGSDCNTGAVTTTPCCYADFNKSGAVSTQDIFDYLDAWFSGSLFARFGGDGSSGTLSVQDIFGFLTAWFAGGC